MSSHPLVTAANAMVDGKYRLLEVIGSGGVGTVYRASHVWTEREVAVKVLHRDLPHLSQLREAFLREARAAVRLRHPNVVDVLDMGEDAAGATYIVMELLSGPTLRDVLFEKKRLSSDETVAVLAPLLDALTNAHRLGIVHRDFKPENIILQTDASGEVVPTLLDFGVAQTIWERQGGSAEAEGEILIGTPQYMSPEQARNQRELIGPQSDVWGVGVVWYECLAGRCPFDGHTNAEVLRAVCEAPLDLTGIPDAHRPLIDGMLRRAVTERTQSLEIVRDQMTHAGIRVANPASTRSSLPTAKPSEPPARVHRTLQGVGPEVKRSLPRVRIDESQPRIPSREAAEIEELPSGSNRTVMIAGAALIVAIGLSAYWSTSDPEEEAAVVHSEPAAPRSAALPSPSVTAQEATHVDVGPFPSAPAADGERLPSGAQADGSQTPPDPIVEDGSERNSADTASPAEALKEDSPDVEEEEPKASEPDIAPAPRKPRARKRAAKRSRTASSPEKPPELVTEW